MFLGNKLNLRGPNTLALTKGGRASSFAPYPAPSGLKWVFVYETTEGGAQVFESATSPNDPLIELVAA